MVIITNDEDTFEWWRERNQSGYILVSHNPPAQTYLRLHSAGCQYVNGNPANGENWTHNYAKVCSMEREEIEAWVSHNFENATIENCNGSHCTSRL